jgi:hypothetical protein
MTRLLAALLLAASAVVAAPQPAACGFCPTYTCFGPCGGDCVCLSKPGKMGGSCYGVQHRDAALARGWRVLE